MRRITYGVFGSHGSSVAQIALSYRTGGQVRNTRGRSKGGGERVENIKGGEDDSERESRLSLRIQGKSSQVNPVQVNSSVHDMT